MITRTVPSTISKKTHKLSSEHKIILRGWFLEGLSTAGIRSRIDLYNQQANAVGAVPFPQLHIDSLGYWRKKMAEEVSYVVNQAYEAEEAMMRRGLRHKEERINRLEWAAEQMEPYIGQASIKGVFSAAEMYCKILEQIRSEIEPVKGFPQQQRLLGIEPADIRSMNIEQVKALASQLKKDAQMP